MLNKEAFFQISYKIYSLILLSAYQTELKPLSFVDITEILLQVFVQFFNLNVGFLKNFSNRALMETFINFDKCRHGFRK